MKALPVASALNPSKALILPMMRPTISTCPAMLQSLPAESNRCADQTR